MNTPDTKTIVEKSSGGIGTMGLLGIVFVVLKLTGFIDWSWWWVTAPFWVPTALVLGIIIAVLAVGGIVLGIANLWDMWERNQRQKKRRRK